MELAHESARPVPSIAEEDDSELLGPRYPFWHLGIEELKTDGPIPPVKLLPHSEKSIYSETKAGVDGST